jgi:hypothetical protein
MNAIILHRTDSAKNMHRYYRRDLKLTAASPALFSVVFVSCGLFEVLRQCPVCFLVHLPQV